MHAEFWPENLEVRDNMGDLRLDGRIILERTLEKYCVDLIQEVEDRVC
jgi:hypothetical protein